MAGPDTHRLAAAEGRLAIAALRSLTRRLRSADDEEAARLLDLVLGNGGALAQAREFLSAAGHRASSRVDLRLPEYEYHPAYAQWHRLADASEALYDIVDDLAAAGDDLRNLPVREAAMDIAPSVPAPLPGGPSVWTAPGVLAEVADDNGLLAHVEAVVLAEALDAQDQPESEETGQQLGRAYEDLHPARRQIREAAHVLRAAAALARHQCRRRPWQPAPSRLVRLAVRPSAFRPSSIPRPRVSQGRPTRSKVP